MAKPQLKPGESQDPALTLRVLGTRSCPTLCDPVDCSPPGSRVHGILQAGILERVATSFSALTQGTAILWNSLSIIYILTTTWICLAKVLRQGTSIPLK